MKPLSKSDFEFIEKAARFLENPGFVISLVEKLGHPIESLQRKLPERAQKAVHKATRVSLEKALGLALTSLRAESSTKPPLSPSDQRKIRRSGRIHQGLAAMAGAAGGVWGIAALPLELPITTLLMLRSIAKIAAEYGEDLSDPTVRLECLYVFSLGSHVEKPESPERQEDVAYYASRIAFARLASDAGGILAREANKVAGSLASRIIAHIAARFETVVAEKALAELVPIIGAAGGAWINSAFAAHFNSAASFHFGLKRLERLYGREAVQEAYQSVKA